MGITLLIVIITGVVSYFALNNSEFMSKWIFNPYLVKKKNEYYRFLTSGFIHADIMHLAFNMISLYYAGNFVEMVFGAWFGSAGVLYYLGLYLLAIIVSDIPTYLKHKNDYNYNGLGASGGVSAVLFSTILVQPWSTFYVFIIPIKAIFFGVLYLFYSYYQGRRSGDNINHDAHLYGALFGIIYTIGIHPEVVNHFMNELLNWNGRLFN